MHVMFLVSDCTRKRYPFFFLFFFKNLYPSIHTPSHLPITPPSIHLSPSVNFSSFLPRPVLIQASTPSGYVCLTCQFLPYPHRFPTTHRAYPIAGPAHFTFKSAIIGVYLRWNYFLPPRSMTASESRDLRRGPRCNG